MYPTATKTALLLAVLLKRSGKTRARVSEKTIKLLSGRVRLRGAFIVDVSAKLEDFGVLAVEADRGGFGLVSIPALEGATAITAKALLPGWRQLSEEDLFFELGVQADEGDD
jgi:hypothetical protein